MKRIIMGVVAAVILALSMSSCASYHADVDQTAVEQDGYVVVKTDKTLVGCHNAGKSGYGGLGNDIFYYPAGQRTFSFTGTSTESEEAPIQVVTKDGQTLHMPGFIKFKLTSNCQDLWDFHRKVGVKYKAYEDTGWTAFLNDYLGVAVNSALNDATGNVGWRALYQDAVQRNKIENSLTEVLNRRVAESLGSDKWIRVTGVSLAKPQASPTLVEGLEASQKAELQNQAQSQVNKLNRTKYQSLADCQKVTTPQNCLILKLAEDGKITTYPVPSGSNVNINPSK